MATKAQIYALAIFAFSLFPSHFCLLVSTTVEESLQINLFMQNKAKFRKSQMNVNKVLTKDYEKKDTWLSGKKQSQTKPNKPNFKKAKMNVTSYITKGYENKPPIRAPKKQSQISKRQKSMQTSLPQRIMKKTAFSGSDKTNPNKANQTQFQRQKNAAKSLTRRYSRGSRLPQIRHCKEIVRKGTIVTDTLLNRRDFVKMMSLGAAALAIPKLLVAGDRFQRKPNFVFILIDDMGFKDIGCNGSTFYETPNIDKLASDGMRFTDAYAACPVCSPTRASIMTGKYPARLNLTDYLVGRRRGKLIPAEYIHQMPLEEVTIAEALKEAGYATCFIGKWHLGDKPYWPEHQGFDVNIGGTRSGMPRNYFWPQWRGNPPIEGRAGEYLTDRLTDEALKFLEGKKDKPFLLYLSHYAVHIPLQAKKDMIEKYKAKAAKHPANGPRFLPEGRSKARQVQDHPVYAGMVESVDESVGRVMNKLEDLGVADNTVVIFMSDNGGLSTAEGLPTSNLPLRAGKGWLYEGGIREPMIIKWPGVVKLQSVCNQPVTSTDFYPTMLEMADLPLKPKQHIDGVSLVPLLKGKEALKRKAIFWHYPHYGNQGGSPGGAVRIGDYKLIEFYEDSRAELYNLKADIGEKKNLAGKMPGKAAKLRKILQTWRKDVHAQMPTPNPDYAPRKGS